LDEKGRTSRRAMWGYNPVQKVIPVILHGVVSPDARGQGWFRWGVYGADPSKEGLGRSSRGGSHGASLAGGSPGESLGQTVKALSEREVERERVQALCRSGQRPRETLNPKQ